MSCSAEMIAEFDAAGLLDRRPLDLAADAAPRHARCSFPARCSPTSATGRLFVSDTGHHRIVVADLDGARAAGHRQRAPGPRRRARARAPVRPAAGAGAAPATRCTSPTPRTTRCAPSTSATGVVTTLAGTGEQLMGERVGGPARADRAQLALGPRRSSTGRSTSRWPARTSSGRCRSGRGIIAPHAGQRARGARRRPARGGVHEPAERPDRGRAPLYVADSEASAIRAVDPAPGGDDPHDRRRRPLRVRRRDGVGPRRCGSSTRSASPGTTAPLYVADTYNHKIKRLDPDDGGVPDASRRRGSRASGRGRARPPVQRAERAVRRGRTALRRRHQRRGGAGRPHRVGPRDDGEVRGPRAASLS